MMDQLCRIIAVTSIALGCAIAHAAAPTYPERPVRLVTGFPPGGATDAIARVITPKYLDALGRQWVVDSRSGAAGNIATEIVVKAPPDGHTVLLVVSTSLTSSPHLFKLPFDVERDLQPVILLATAQYLMGVHTTVKANSLKEFVELARAQPHKINYASVGVGSPHHLAAELFKMRAGIDMAHVPYKGGGPAAAALLGNEVQVMFGSLPALFPHARTGRIKGLAVTGPQRTPLAPDIPTVDESGYPGFGMTSWYGLLVPARTPGHIVTTLYENGRKIMELPDVRQGIQQQGLDITVKDPQQFARHIRTETELMAKIIRAANIRIE